MQNYHSFSYDIIQISTSTIKKIFISYYKKSLPSSNRTAGEGNWTATLTHVVAATDRSTFIWYLKTIN